MCIECIVCLCTHAHLSVCLQRLRLWGSKSITTFRANLKHHSGRLSKAPLREAFKSTTPGGFQKHHSGRLSKAPLWEAEDGCGPALGHSALKLQHTISSGTGRLHCGVSQSSSSVHVHAHAHACMHAHSHMHTRNSWDFWGYPG
jgi:hypothetical protein